MTYRGLETSTRASSQKCAKVSRLISLWNCQCAREQCVKGEQITCFCYLMEWTKIKSMSLFLCCWHRVAIAGKKKFLWTCCLSTACMEWTHFNEPLSVRNPHVNFCPLWNPVVLHKDVGWDFFATHTCMHTQLTDVWVKEFQNDVFNMTTKNCLKFEGTT